MEQYTTELLEALNDYDNGLITTDELENITASAPLEIIVELGL